MTLALVAPTVSLAAGVLAGVAAALGVGGLALLVRRRSDHGRAVPERAAIRGADAPGVAPLGTMACPHCRRRYDAGATFCPRDARALVPLIALSDGGEGGGAHGLVCPACHRSFDEGNRYCAFDAEELVAPSPFLEHRHGRSDALLVGARDKICPQCAARYNLEATFCGQDGAELLLVN